MNDDDDDDGVGEKSDPFPLKRSRVRSLHVK